MEVTRLQGIFKLLSVSETDSGVKLLLSGKRGDITAFFRGDDLEKVMELCGEDIRVTGTTEGDINYVNTVVPHNTEGSSKKDESDDIGVNTVDKAKTKERQTYNEYSLIIQWYVMEFPDDDAAAENMSALVNFKDCYQRMKNGEDFYQIIKFADSLTRERVFTKMSEILGIEYEEIYNTWRENASYVNKKGKSEKSKGEEDKDKEDVSSLVEGGAALEPETPLDNDSAKTLDNQAEENINEDDTVSLDEAQDSLFDILGIMTKESIVTGKTDNKKERPKKEKKIRTHKITIDREELIILIKEAVREVLAEERA